MATSVEQVFRESLKKQLIDLYKDSLDIIERLDQFDCDLREIYQDWKSLKPGSSPSIAHLTSTLNKLKTRYNDFVMKQAELEVECTGLKMGPPTEAGLDEDLLRSKFTQACLEQRLKGVKLDKEIEVVDHLIDLIDILMRS